MLNLAIKKQLGHLSLDIEAQIPLQGVCAVFGRSGAGKTSLINILGGLSTPDSGTITLNDQVLYDHESKINLAPEHRHIGYVFQEARLFPHYTVRGNLNYGNKDKDLIHFNDIVSLLGLETLLDSYPKTLSGGEKQRVAIGRALLTRPKMLLMDEPLAALDLPRKRELIPYLLNLTQRLKLPIIYVSHSLDEILQLADNMLVINDGKVLVNGPLNDVWDSEEMRPWLPAKEQSALLWTKVTEINHHYQMTKLSLNENKSLWINGIHNKLDQTLRVRIHANHVSICTELPTNTSIRNIIPVIISEIRQDDKHENVQVKLLLDDKHIWANITRWSCDELKLSIGQSVYAQIKGVNMTESDLAQSI